MKTYKEILEGYIEREMDIILAQWETIVNMQGASTEPEKVIKVLEYVEHLLTQEGLFCQIISTGGGVPMLIADDFKEDCRPIILSGHVDTVFPVGFFSENPFHREGDTVFGPGVADMKGGVILIVSIVKALHYLGFQKLPIRILLVGDEETAHRNGTAGELLTKYSEGALFALNMETGRLDEHLTTGRKGGAECRITVTGTGGHAGYDSQTALNAVVEMAHKIIAIQNISRYDEGITVNVDVVHGGTATNVIPDNAYADVDIRFNRNEDWEPVYKELQQICRIPVIKGTITIPTIMSYIPAFEASEDTTQLLVKLNRTAEELGLEAREPVFVPGNSDASYLSLAGIPVLCSCGIRGGAIHTTQEFAHIDSMKERLLLFTSFLADTITESL